MVVAGFDEDAPAGRQLACGEGAAHGDPGDERGRRAVEAELLKRV